MYPYVITEDDAKQNQINFTYHSPKGDQQARYQDLRDTARSLAELILATVPKSRERSLALTQLEQAIFWANAGIARNE